MNRSLEQAINRALKVLREVEHRLWPDILLSSYNPVDSYGEALKFTKIAVGYKKFISQFPEADIEARLEAYAVLQVAYNGTYFPARSFLNRAQFEFLLDCHLDNL